MTLDISGDFDVFVADWGQTVEIKTVDVPAIVNQPFAEVTLGDGTVEDIALTIIVKTSTIAPLAVVHGDPVILADTDYVVSAIQPDGDNITILQLREA